MCVRVHFLPRSMKQVKTKYRNRLADETLGDSLRLATTNILVLLKAGFSNYGRGPKWGREM